MNVPESDVKIGDVQSINSDKSAPVYTKTEKKCKKQNTPCYHAKIVITGDLNVGKTSMVRALLGPENPISTLKGQKTGRVKTELRRTDSNIKLDIWDTAGLSKACEIVGNQKQSNVIMPQEQLNSQIPNEKMVQLRPILYAKVVMLGDLNVGKTSLVSRLCYEHNGYMRPSTFNKLELSFEDLKVRMFIYDTGGQERYRSLTASYYRGTHGCLVLFDVTKHHTFDSLTSWIQDLKQYTMYPEKVSTLIVGTKCHATKREVPKAKAEAFADHVGLPYMEVSSEEDINVRAVFDLLADHIIQAFKRHPSMIDVQPTAKLTDNNTKDKFSFCSC